MVDEVSKVSESRRTEEGSSDFFQLAFGLRSRSGCTIKPHPQSLEIYEKLDPMMGEIVELGYVTEKLVIAFTSLKIVQSHRNCTDCHIVIKLLTFIIKSEVVAKNAS